MRGVCPSCGRVAFRNAKPAVGLLIEREGELLLVKRAREPYRGRWDLPGGFLEEDEEPEDGALREALEETGLRIRLGRLVGVYHDRSGDDHTFNAYYTAHVIGGREQAGDDASDMRWFPVAKIPASLAFPGHTQAVMRDWRKGRKL